MLRVENVEIAGWKSAIRNLYNQSDFQKESDSRFDTTTYWDDDQELEAEHYDVIIGDNDFYNIKHLPEECRNRFLQMITVHLDITAPLYWWKEFDMYEASTVINSYLTEHEITDKEFTLDDFSYEHLENSWLVHLKETIRLLNEARDAYHWCNTDAKKEWWWQMIQLLPSSYNQCHTIVLNYKLLAEIYKSCRNYKLDEWHTFHEWIESLPYSELIIGEENINES